MARPPASLSHRSATVLHCQELEQLKTGGAAGPEGSSPGDATTAEAPGVPAALAPETMQEVPAVDAPAAADVTIDSPPKFEAAPPEEPPSSVVATTLAEEAAGVVPGSEPKPELAPGRRVPVREYLDSTVVPVLREGLRKLCKER